MIGQTVSHYRILEKLGEGGMGVVYKAQDLKLDRLVALKFLPPHLQTDEETRKRFIHEAKAASALDHPNIITVHDIDHTADGRMFIATAYYEGETLGDRLSRGRLTLVDTMDVVSQVAKGLERAHEKKIVHRDIKPTNIFITRDNLIKIVDFGLAKLAGQTKVTKTGTTVGTVAYMSPEQARGEEVDHRSDIFSLGAVLYEMITGERPFRGDHEAAVVYSILNEEPLPLAHHRPDVPKELQSVVSKMLAKDRGKRYTTAGEVLNDLSRLETGPSAAAAPRSRRRTRAVRTVAAVFLVLLASTTGYWVWNRFSPASSRGSLGLGAVPREFMVVVAPFWGVDEEAQREGKVMQALVERRLRDMIGAEEGVRIVAKTIEAAPRTPDEARSLGKTMGASIVLWGEVLTLRGEVEIQPYMTVIGSRVAWSSRESREDPNEESGKSLLISLAEPDQFKLRSLKADEIGRLATLAAARFYRKRDPEKAMAIIDGIKPPMAESEQLRGSILADDQRWDEAKTAYEAAVELDPESPWPLIGLAWVHQQRKEYETAISTYTKAIERDPKKVQAYCYLGSVYRETGDYDAAMRQYERAKEIDPRNVWPYIGIGYTYWFQGRNPDAVKAYEKAAAVDPSDPAPHMGLAWIYSFWKPKKYAKEYEKAVALDPDNVSALQHLASYYSYRGRYRDAINLLQRGLALEPYDMWCRITLSRVYEQQGKLDLARKELEQAVSLKPRDPLPHDMLANFYLERGDTSNAVMEFERAIEHDVDHECFTAGLNLGGIYLARGRLDEAERLFRQAAEGDSSFVRLFVGCQFLFKGRYERALEVYREALADSSTDDAVGVESVYYYMGMTYERMDRLHEAFDAYAKSAELADSTLFVYHSLPYYVALCRMNRAQEAIAWARSLSDSTEIRESAEDGALYFHLKILDFLAGRLSEKELWKETKADNQGEGEANKVLASYYIGMTYVLGVPVRLSRSTPDTERAREYFENALAIQHRYPGGVAPEESERSEFELKRLRTH